MNTQNQVIKLNQFSSLLVLILISPVLLCFGIISFLKSTFMKEVIKTLIPICVIVFLCFFGGYKYGAEKIDMISVAVVAVVCYILGIWVAKN
jgi:hypothetical protein